ncbi:MAG: DNA recombination protein RmuC [Solirubrobacteraceae bacterium]
MDNLEITLLLLCLFLIATVLYFFFKNLQNKLTFNQFKEKEIYLAQQHLDKIKLYESQKNDLLKEYNEQKNIIANNNKEFNSLTNQITSISKDKISLEEKLKTQKDELEKLNEKFSKEFENLANKILEKNSETLNQRSKLNIESILNPLKEKIFAFENKIDQTHKESLTTHAGLKQQIEDLSKLNEKITTEAKNLTKALKGENKTQGNWGEFILESILEKSGLIKDREYFTQQQLFNQEGKKFQPDVTIQLPNNKQIIIDSKVSLLEYEKYYNADEPEIKKIHLNNHLNSIKAHINGLTSKEYQKLQGINTLDFIILFSPIEGALNLAFTTDNQLFNYGFERNIILASPSNLIAMLKTISSVWKREYQNKNVIEIAEKAGDLYDKFVAVLEDFHKLGNQLGTVQTTYSESMKKLSTGKGNLVKRVEEIKKLGANTSKQIDQKWLDKSEV